MYLLLGILYIVLGLIVINHPGESLIAISIYFSIFILISGIGQLFFSLSNRDRNGWGWHLIIGILETIIGIYLVMSPLNSIGTLIFFVGFWFLFRSISIIGTALSIKNHGESQWGWVMLSGCISLVFSFFIIFSPLLASMSIVWLVGMWLLFGGVSTIFTAIRMRRIANITS